MRNKGMSPDAITAVLKKDKEGEMERTGVDIEGVNYYKPEGNGDGEDGEEGEACSLVNMVRNCFTVHRRAAPDLTPPTISLLPSLRQVW